MERYKGNNNFPDKSTIKIRRMFSDIAPTYDLINRILSLGIDRKWRYDLVKNFKKGDRVLDLACGTADVALSISDVTMTDTLAIDFSYEMLLLAAKKVSKKKSRVSLVCGDCSRLPVKDNSFDGITIAFGLRNIEDSEGFFAESNRVLRIRGRLAILEFENSAGGSVIYRFYLNSFVPFIGNVISRSSAYSYLTESVNTWLTHEEITSIAAKNNFVLERSKRWLGGIVRTTIFQKNRIIAGNEM